MTDKQKLKELRRVIIGKLEGCSNVKLIYDYLHICQDINFVLEHM